MTPAISPENSWLNEIVSVKDSCTRSSRDCKHRQPPASRGLLRWRAVRPLHRADGRWRRLFFFFFPLSLLLCLLKTVFSILTTNPHTHKKQQAGRFDNIAFICLRLSRALSDNWQLFLRIWIACLNLEAVRVSIVLREAWHPTSASRFIEIKNV